MVNMETGMFAKSKAGHDRNKLYIIIRSDAEYVWLADGIYKTVEKPKKKKKIHIQVIRRIPETLQNILDSGMPLQNKDIIDTIESECRDKREEENV